MTFLKKLAKWFTYGVATVILLVFVIAILAEFDNEKAELPVVTNPETVSADPVQKVEDAPPVYTVIEEKNSSFGSRSRISLNIELPEALTDRNKIRAMMAAAVARHRKDWPDAISVRLWRSYESDGTALNRIVYAPDGCGWAGYNCSHPLWTDLLRGTLPIDLADWGRPTEEEKQAGKELICRQDLQCWGERHIVDATVTCEVLIERMAKYDYEWTNGFLERKLQRWRWEDRAVGTIAYTGNRVKFQNGFGAWQHMTYWCFYDPGSETARVHLLSGR